MRVLYTEGCVSHVKKTRCLQKYVVVITHDKELYFSEAHPLKYSGYYTNHQLLNSKFHTFPTERVHVFLMTSGYHNDYFHTQQ
jgi:hypothetical protein